MRSQLGSLILLCLVITLALFGAVPHPAITGAGFDEQQYWAMAQGAPVLAPFAYRLLTPTLAHVLPFDLQTNFQAIAILALWLTGPALYALARAYDFPPALAFLGVLMFYSLPYGAAYLLSLPWLCEPLLFLLLTLALWSLKTRHDRLFALFLALGVLDKETMLAVAPLWFVLRPREARRGLALMAPAVVLFVLVHLLIVPTISYSVISQFTAAIKSRLMHLRETSPGTVLFELTVGSFGVWCVPALFAFRRRGLGRSLWPFIALIYAQLLIATNTERLLVTAFPAVILMVLQTMHAVAGLAHLAPRVKGAEAA